MECLELGAGYRPYDDGFNIWVHNDIRPGPDIEIVCDIRKIENYTEPGWDVIRATHVMEHFSPVEGRKIMNSVHRLLIPSGTFYIEVPNFTWQTKAHYLGDISDDEAVMFVYGEQDYLENTHKNGYTMTTLRRDLTEADFGAIVVEDIGQVLVASGTKL